MLSLEITDTCYRQILQSTVTDYRDRWLGKVSGSSLENYHVNLGPRKLAADRDEMRLDITQIYKCRYS
jgi:hypothetical protein